MDRELYVGSQVFINIETATPDQLRAEIAWLDHQLRWVTQTLQKCQENNQIVSKLNGANKND